MMIEINFKFKNQDNIIKCDIGRLFKDVCEEFAKKVKVDLDYTFFIYNGVKINLAMNYYVGQQFNLESEDNKQVELIVFQEIPFSIVFKYKGVDYVVGSKENEMMKNIFEKFEKKANISLRNVFFIYSGNIMENMEGKTLDQIINRLDRAEKVMTILVNDLERNSINEKDNINNEKLYRADNDDDNNINNDYIISNENENKNENENENNNHNDSRVTLINQIPENNDIYFFKILNNMRPVYIILIQISIIILIVGVGGLLGWNERFKNDVDFLEIILLVFLVICFIICIILVIIFYFLKKKFISNWWYIYHIYYIPLITIICYCFTYVFDYRLILVYLFIMAFGLIPVIILKGERVRLVVLLTFVSNAIIIVPLLILLKENSNFSAIAAIISGASFAYDVFLGFVYHYSGGLFYIDDNKMPVLMFDYGFFSVIVFSLLILFYPLYWLSKKCIIFFDS